MANFEGPTPEDFAALNKQIAEWDTMDRIAHSKYVQEYHVELPRPYGQAVAKLDLSDIHVVRELNSAIEADANLSVEQKFAMQHELSDRARTSVLSKAPEGWND